MKQLVLAALVLALLPLSLHAQSLPQADVAVNYSLLRVGTGNGYTLNGFSASAAYNINDWFGVVGDFGAYHGAGFDLAVETYTFGPRFSYRKSQKIVPFAQALFGGSHASGSLGGFSAGSSNAFAFAFGGGADIVLGSSGKFAFRPQVEYFGFHSGGPTANAARISLGLVYHIGGK